MATGKERERACSRKLPLLKPSDLMRPIYYHENSMGEIASMIQLFPTGPLPHQVGITEVQFQMRSGWGHNQTTSPCVPAKGAVIHTRSFHKCLFSISCVSGRVPGPEDRAENKAKKYASSPA